MSIARPFTVCVTLIFLCIGLSPVAQGCPFCAAPSLTLSEQLAQSDATILVKWMAGKKPEGQTPGSTTYEVTKVVMALKGTLDVGDEVTLSRYRTGKKGDLFMLMGTQGTVIEWGSPLEVTETSFKYIEQAPGPDQAATKRLAYYLKFLEFPDQLVSNDAFAEFANAPYKDIVPLAKKMPIERIRKWVLSDDTPVTRLGLYGLMLGLCGTAEDAEVMKKKISESTQDFRLGIDGVMSGYLLLTGDKGLDLIDKTKLKNKDVPFSETYAAMQALRFMWTYEGGKISKDRLRQSMRTLLDRPELADLVIADLARWQDWSVQDKLMELYGAKEYNIPSIKRAIIRYMLVSAKFTPSGENVEVPARVTKGKKHLKTLEEKDPKTVKEAKRFFFLK